MAEARLSDKMGRQLIKIQINRGGMTMKFSNKVLIFMALTLFISLGTVSRGIASDVTVKVGAAFDITGPYSDLGMLRAFQDCIRWTNEKGGFKDVKGNTCKIKLVWQDCQSNIPKGMAAYKDFKAQGCVVHFYSSTGQNFALKKRGVKDKIPFISQLVSNIVYEGKDSWIYSTSGGQRESAIQALDGFKQVLPKVFKKDRPPKIGFMGWNNIIGEDYVPFARAYAKKLGFETGPDVYFSMKALDVSPQLRTLADAKCDYSFLSMAGGQEAMVLKNRYNMGLHEKLKFLLMSPSVVAWATIKHMEPKYYNGNLLAFIYATQHDNSWGSNLMIDLQKKYHKGDVMWDLFEDYSIGFNNTYFTMKVIELALKTVPGDKLTGADIMKYGLNKVKITDTKGLAMGFDCTLYPGNRNPTTGGRVFEQRDGKLVRLTDWIPNKYQAPYSPTAPQWVKDSQKELMQFMKKKKAKKKK